MDIQTAKQIRLEEYLHSLGYSPVKQQGTNLWYKSPFREETEASFKVNTERNQWYDFALGKGGNIIALASRLYATDSVPYLLKRIEEQAPHVRPVSFSFRKQSFTEPSFQQLEIVPLSSPALLAYLQERGINPALAKRECREARFTHNGKRYFAVAFPNILGGYEIRNRYFKGCIAPKDITHIRQQGEPKDTCYVFEGFMDYLSFLTLRLESCPQCPDFDRQDYMVLNLCRQMFPRHSTRWGAMSASTAFLTIDRAGMEALRKSARNTTAPGIYGTLHKIYCGCKRT